jgi:indole-3-acetate monooxygenase
MSETTAATGQLLDGLRGHAELLANSASEADRLARLPPQVVRVLVQLNLFRLWVPKRYGGLELSLPDALHVYEAAARIDGSVGWAVMIGAGGGLFAAFLPPATASALFERPDAVIAGSGAPGGRAQREKNGYRVTGTWRYASGVHYATTFTANCVVMEGTAPVLDAQGQPLIRAMAFEAPQVAILPGWDTIGMRGTGSDDFEVRDAFVPEHRSFSVFTDQPRESGPLYRLPFIVLTQLPVTAVAVGIATHVLEAFATLMRTKYSHPAETLLSDDAVVRSSFAVAFATCQSAAASVDFLAGRAWQSARHDRSLSATELAEIATGCTLAVARMRATLAELIALSGMSALQPDSGLMRAWRDLQALAAHESVSPRHFADAGGVLLGPPG